LHYNFTRHIWPRCEALREMGNKNFDIMEALTRTDKEFCQKFEVPREVLERKKSKKKYIEEKDELWVYATGGK